MKYTVFEDRMLFRRDPMLFGHFLEHFHRQIYGGVYMPGHPLSDEDGFRTDVLDALRHIRVPIIRWPGGCFVSSYHWEKGVGTHRVPFFDKAWRVEDDNSFGTDEFIKLCRKLGCEPYICTNAGTGDEEEMSNWMEYCNLPCEGEYARRRIANGYTEPHNVKYWSIGNENYGGWEIGAKSAEQWGRLVLEAAKMMKHVDPTTQLSAAALPDIKWNTHLLESAGSRLDWISIHGYWDGLWEENISANYKQCMAYTNNLDAGLNKVRGLLMAYGLEKCIRVAYDEWNLRGWHHPNAHTLLQGVTKEDYLYPRDKNDLNETYTMADAVFSACFLNMLLRNADLVGMANFAPVVNTRGAIFTYDKGLVLRTTYYVFDMYVNHLGEEVLDAYAQGMPIWQVSSKEGQNVTVDAVDMVATRHSLSGRLAIAAVNKHDICAQEVTLNLAVKGREINITTLAGKESDDYNDVGRTHCIPYKSNSFSFKSNGEVSISLPPHSVNIIEIG